MSEQDTGYVVHKGCDHIFFVGFLGAGKSTLARNLGGLFNRDFVDTDKLVERARHMSVCQIFECDGERRFRDYEVEALGKLRSRKSLLVSCGGGIVEDGRSCAIMHEMGKVVFLDGDLVDSLRQIRHPELRPDFGCLEAARKLYQARRPLYQGAADITIDIRGKSFEQVCSLAGCVLWEEGLL